MANLGSIVDNLSVIDGKNSSLKYSSYFGSSEMIVLDWSINSGIKKDKEENIMVKNINTINPEAIDNGIFDNNLNKYHKTPIEQKTEILYLESDTYVVYHDKESSISSAQEIEVIYSEYQEFIKLGRLTKSVIDNIKKAGGWREDLLSSDPRKVAEARMKLLSNAYDYNHLPSIKDSLYVTRSINAELRDELQSKLEKDFSNPTITKELHDKLLTMSYYQTLYLEEHPEHIFVEVAALPAATLGIGEAMSAINAAYRMVSTALAFSKFAGAEIHLEDLSSELKESLNIKDKEQKKEGSRVDPSMGAVASGGAPDPDHDPDDGEKEGTNFDPSKQGNHDKVSRHPNSKYGKFYRDVKDQKIWWSKDTAGHGGEHWKKFEEIGKELFRKADVDMAGNVIPKNTNSSYPNSIKLKDLIGIK